MAKLEFFISVERELAVRAEAGRAVKLGESLHAEATVDGRWKHLVRDPGPGFDSFIQ